MDVVVGTEPIRAVLEKVVNALQTASLLAAQIESDQRELRRAIDRAVAALDTVKPTEK